MTKAELLAAAEALEWALAGFSAGHDENELYKAYQARIVELRKEAEQASDEPVAIVCTEAEPWRLIGSEQNAQWHRPGAPRKTVMWTHEVDIGAKLYAHPSPREARLEALLRDVVVEPASQLCDECGGVASECHQLCWNRRAMAELEAKP